MFLKINNASVNILWKFVAYYSKASHRRRNACELILQTSLYKLRCSQRGLYTRAFPFTGQVPSLLKRQSSHNNDQLPNNK